MTDFIERLRSAADRVSRHCFNKQGDTALMTIPADPQRDVDLLLCQAADEIERLRGLLREVATWRIAVECVAPELGGLLMTFARIDAALAGAAVQPDVALDRPWQEIVKHATRYLWLRERINFRDQFVRSEDGHGISTKWRAWVHDDYRENPPASEHIDEYIDGQLSATDPTPAPQPQCACEYYWPGQGHHPDCPTRATNHTDAAP